MRIFGRKKITEVPDLTLVPAQEGGEFDFFSALAKALLLFLLAYGALGGFLSAIEVEYNNSLCMLVLFVLALFLSAAYETGKRWLQNLACILYFILYLYITITRSRFIVNGYFSVLNQIYEIARIYLDVNDGMVYSISITETYTTITMFALFLGMVLVILLNIMLQNKCSLLKIIVFTLPPYVIPFYLDRSPDFIYVLFLLIGYLTIALLRGSNINVKLAKRMRYTLPLTAILTILIVQTASLILTEREYRRIIPKNAAKEASEENMMLFAQYGLMALFRNQSSGLSVDNGRLSKAASVMPSYETMIKVRYTPYDYHPVYLKSFTGKQYLGDRWTRAGNMPPDDGLMMANVDNRIEWHQAGSRQGRGLMEVERLNDADVNEYLPYYTDVDSNERHGNVSVYTYYPATDQAIEVYSEAADAYLDVPASCLSAVAKVCKEANFSGTEEEIAEQIVNFFQTNYSYTLRPGFYFGNPDYITHFLQESKKGYCAHFASAGTMLFRYMGIPARYVEGYAFSYADVVEIGEIVEGAEYSDYYYGYAPLGETAVVEIDIPGSYAHAWVEIYVDGKGWIVVDPTPSQVTEEDTTSFWDAFMVRSGDDIDLEIAEDNIGTYLEGALSGISYVLPAAAVLFAIAMGIKYLRRISRLKKLSSRERARLEYSQIQSYLVKKHWNYRKLQTIQTQLGWIRDNCHTEISEELEKALYQLYFAENVDYDCEELCRQLRQIRKTLRHKKS